MKPLTVANRSFNVGDPVRTDGVNGWVRGTVWKIDGSQRYIVEDEDGLLHIANVKRLKTWQDSGS